MTTTNRVSRGELLHVAYEVAWRFEAYDSYGRTPATAVRALRRRCPGYTARQYQNAFQRARELYSTVCEFVRERSDDVWERYRAEEEIFALFDSELRARFPGFRKATFHQAVAMTFYYWHLR